MISFDVYYHLYYYIIYGLALNVDMFLHKIFYIVVNSYTNYQAAVWGLIF